MSYISLAIIVSFSMPKSSRALIISMTIPSGPLALFPFILDTAARISDCRIFGPSMFFRISGLPPLLSRNSSSMYSVHLSRMSYFSVIMVPAFERMQPLDEHVFAPVKSFILLCIAFVSVSFPFSISAHSFFNHSSFASLHFFLISRGNYLYSSLFLCGIACLLCIILSISSVIHLFLDCFVFFGMVSFAVSTRASLNTSHVVLLPSCSKTENLSFTSIAYMFLMSWLFCNWH